MGVFEWFLRVFGFQLRYWSFGVSCVILGCASGGLTALVVLLTFLGVLDLLRFVFWCYVVGLGGRLGCFEFG